MSEEKHCPTCSCGRRVAVQMDLERGQGTIRWDEHVAAWEAYHDRYKGDAEWFARMCPFGYDELTRLLGHPPKTWVPRQM